MRVELQSELDALAARLDRNISLDDAAGTVLGYGIHDGAADPVRVAAILTRRVTPAVQAWQAKHGVSDATRPVRLPANAELGMTARLCVPIRLRGRPLGYLWIQDSGEELGPSQVAEARRSASRLRALLLDHVIDDAAPSADDLFRGLLTGEQPDAAAALLAAVAPIVESRVRILVALLDPPPADPDGVDDESRAAGRVPAARRARTVAALHSTRTHLAILLGGAAGHGTAFDPACDAVLAALGTGAPLAPSAGVSSSLPFTAGALRLGYAQAVAAARCSAADPALPRRAAWRDLRLYTELLDTLPGERESILAPLADADVAPAFLDTLERYLDLGCDAQRTAAALSLHRTSLYYRLGRIATLLGVDLGDGLTRTHLHVALKRRRLAAHRLAATAAPELAAEPFLQM